MLPSAKTALSGIFLVTPLLSPICPPWLSDRTNGNWQASFPVPHCYCFTPHFCKPCALLAACFIMASCLAYSSNLKMEATCASKTSIDFYITSSHCCENLNSYIPQNDFFLNKSPALGMLINSCTTGLVRVW